MATQTFTTTYEPTEFKSLLADCLSETIKNEIAKLLETQKPEKNIYTRLETAEILSISLPTLNEYTKQGIIKAYRLGYKVRYKLVDIEKALTSVDTKKRS